jgi:hypothetical protein
MVASHLGEEPGETPYISSAAAARSRSPKMKKLALAAKSEPMDNKMNVKREISIDGGDAKRRNTAESKARVRPASADADRVTGLNMNRSKDMSFWEQQSGNELRTKIGMRPGQIRADYAKRIQRM